MTFSDFSDHLQKLESVSSRLEMTELLAQLFKELGGEEIRPASYLLQGRLVPLYQSLEFNLSTKMVLRSLARIAAQTADTKTGQAINLFGEEDSAQFEQQVQSLFKKNGDLGLVAEEVLSKAEKKNSQATLLSVFEKLERIAQDSGTGSQERKLAGLVELLLQVDAQSAKFITRIVLGRLRLGFSTMTLIDALSWAVTGGKDDRTELEHMYNKRADIGHLAEIYLPLAKQTTDQRHKKLASYSVTFGVPVMPALCQRLNSSSEIIDKMGPVIVEPKYDGMRVQLHISEKTFQVFTRNLDNVTHMFPELQDAHSRMQAEQVILDGEVIGYDKKTGKLLPFQETITRRRKHNVGETAASVPVRFYLFDVLLKDKTSLINEKLQTRKEVLNSLFEENEVLHKTPYIITDDPEKFRTEHHRFLAENLEGAVAKKVNSPYISGRKGWAWVKIKEEEGTTGKLSDTLDLIVMGYNAGRGKRAQFGIGTVLAGVLDADQNVVTIAKIGTGMSEDQLQKIKKLCDELKISEKPSNYKVHKDLQPDFWITPKLVIEVAADELTTSPKHTAKKALRFPRLVAVRSDKNWDQATTLEELKGIH